MKKQIAALLLSGLAVSGITLAGTAMADEHCKAPRDQWQSEEALRAAVADRGWEIRTFEIDDGCYEIEGYDQQGRRVEASFNPQTLEMVEMELED